MISKKETIMGLLKDIQEAIEKYYVERRKNLYSPIFLSFLKRKVLRNKDRGSVLIRLGIRCPESWNLKKIENDLNRLGYFEYQVKWILNLFKEVKRTRMRRVCSYRNGLLNCFRCKYKLFCNNLASISPSGWDLKKVEYALTKLGMI